MGKYRNYKMSLVPHNNFVWLKFIYRIHICTILRRISLLGVFSILAFLAIITACSTKKNAVVNRAYHNLTAHYNGYFNAREKVKEGTKTLAASQEDHYDRLLSVFRYSTDEKAKTLNTDMDEAIKKSSIVIQRHSMFINGKERCKWIPDNYMVIGKAQFLKHDFWTALETFQYVASTYKEHPTHYEGLIWLMQTQMQLGKMADAEYLLDFLKNEKNLPKKYKPLFAAVAADFHIKKENYPKAIEQLKVAVVLAKKRADRIRYSYILAQLYQKTDSNEKAFALYKKVIKMNPEYEMAFNAKINRARSFDINSAEGAKVKEELMKMLKDEKNVDYLDQIYYALASIALIEKDTTKGFNYLQQSVGASTTNTNQKGISYLDMGEIGFRKKDFRAAQKYYDSAATFIATDYPDYTIIQNKKNNLSRLIKNLNIISSGDSLLALGNMSAADQEKKIDEIIKAEEDAADKLRQDSIAQKVKEDEEQVNQQFNPLQTTKEGLPNSGGLTGGAWYFYNPSALSFGFGEFTKKWGNRKLEDNWRRSSKESNLAVGNVDEDAANAFADSLEQAKQAMNDSIRQLNSEGRKAAYLANVPKTQQQKDETNAEILEAYYNAGVIYKEALTQPEAAAIDFEDMMKRYPDNKYKLPAYYNLYRCYLAINDEPKAEYYKKIILDNYGDSEYARIISNPNYYKDALRKTAIMQVFYENTFRAFQNKQYADVIERKSTADSLFPGGALAPKFAYLKSMSIGYTQPQPVFEASLKDIIASYPKDSVSILAKAILEKMKAAITAPKFDSTAVKATGAANGSESAMPPQGSLYKYNSDAFHIIMIVFPVALMEPTELKARLAVFNEQNYNEKRLNVANLNIDENTYVMIRSMNNSITAQQYITSINMDQSVFEGFDKNQFKLFPITDENFNKYVLDKDLNKYLDFYRVNYGN